MDFQPTAMKSGMAFGASSLADMISIIARQAAGSISLLGLIGHAAEGPRTFGFSGRITASPPGVVLTPSGFLNADDLGQLQPNNATKEQVREGCANRFVCLPYRHR